MAFVQDETQQAQPAQTQQSVVPAGGAGVAGSNKQSQPGKNVPAQPSAQLSAYLNANQTQGQQMAGNIAGNLSTQVQGAQNAINPAVSSYTGNLYTVPTDQAVNQTVATSPSQLTADQTATFQKELSAGQNAPNSANTFETTQPYQDLAGQIQSAVQTASLWNAGNSPANLSTAIQPFESAGATPGDTTLDALLISQNPQAYGQIQNAVAPAANLQSNLSSATGQANQALRDAIAKDQAATAAAQAAPQTFAGNLSSYLNNAVSTSSQAAASENARILKDMTNNSPTQEDLTALGVTPEQWTTLSGEMQAAADAGVPISLPAYLTQQSPSGITPQNIATQQQYSDVAALANLLGGNAPVEPITSSTANLAGTAPTNFNTFDLSNAEKAASNNATIKGLVTQAQADEAAGQAANSGWTYNHFGGQSNQEFNDYIGKLNAQINSINNQIAAILGQSPGYTPIGGVGNPNVPGVGSQAGNYIPVISDISNVAGSVGNWLGI